jgi:hypothetical protein
LNFCTKETGEEPELSLASTGLLFFLMKDLIFILLIKTDHQLVH